MMEDVDEIFENKGPESSLNPPKIDLYNFEDPEFEDSKYVLTSPRSLEACAKNGVKPVDLLYKPLSDFQEELLPQDVPLRTIYNIYDEHERTRQRKLKKCRDDRNKIKSAPGGQRSRNRPQSAAGRINHIRKSRAFGSYGGMQRSHSDEDIERTIASLQRKRTAWVSSIGHKRITRNELDNRISELHEESMKLRNELLSHKDKPRTRKVDKARNTSKTSLSKSRSASNLSLSCSSLLNKSSLRDAKPIENSRLRRTLSKSQDLSSIAVSSKDQKILELMMSKGEEEKLSNRGRFLADLAWDEQRQVEEQLKVQAEMKRRHLLAEENRIKDMKKQQKEKRRQKQEEKFIEMKERKLQESMKTWQQHSQNQLKLRDLQLSQKKEKEDLRKRIQEKNKKLLDKDEEEMMAMVKMKHDHDLKSAAQKKENRLLQETMRKLLDSRREVNSFEQRRKCIVQMNKEEEENLATSINSKHQHASENYLHVQQRRGKQLAINKLEREKRLLQAKVSQTRLEDQMEEWRESIKDHRKAAEEHAAEVVATKTQLKAKRAHDNRINKEKSHTINQKRIQRKEKQRIRNVEKEIAMKHIKTKSMEFDKNHAISKLREVAHQSEQLRNDLRERYGGESFDKKVFRVELYNKLGLGQCKNIKKKSNAKS